MVDEVGDQLQENGAVTIADLAKIYDLPGDFISQVTFTEWLKQISKCYAASHSEQFSN